jgi:Cell Wall Hydrolase
MGRSRIRWALSVAAPWCVAFAVLVSITAEAEQEPLGFMSAFAPTRLSGASGGLDPATFAERPLRVVDEDGAPLPIVQASYVTGDRDELSANSDEIEPKGALKQPDRAFPAVDRGAKGDPLAAVPGAKRLNGRRTQAEPSAFKSWPSELEDPRGDEFDSGHTMSPQRPADGDEPETAALSFDDGATPAAPLEFALNSSSPTSSDGVVVVVESDGSGLTTVPQLSAADGKPNYAALIDPKDSARQMRCLAEAIYFESRSEPEEGQAAVAQVVLNRVRSGIYPTTVCGVVYQDRNRPFACQFSFACEGKSLRIEEPGPWAVATRIAQNVVSGANYNPKVDVAVNYHANYVAPFWTGYLRKVDHIGAHIFYAMRDGTNWAPGALNGRGDHPPVAN